MSATIPVYVDIPLSNGDLNPFASGYIDGVDRTLQAIQVMIQTGVGEYIFDTAWGFPWPAWAMAKPMDTVAAQVLFTARIGTEPGVTGVQKVSVTQTGDTVNVGISITLADGTSATGTGVISGIAAVQQPWVWSLTGGWGGRGIVLPTT
jgi:hypothetical protein